MAGAKSVMELSVTDALAVLRTSVSQLPVDQNRTAAEIALAALESSLSGSSLALPSSAKRRKIQSGKEAGSSGNCGFVDCEL